MPQELQEWLPRSEVLNYDEITRLVRIASDLGVSKIRITGGEPLTRRDVLKLFQQLSELRGITDIGLSTNGSLLAKPVDGGQTVASALVKFRVRTANISLDKVIPLLSKEHWRGDSKCHKKREQLNETFTAPVVIEIGNRRHNVFHDEC
jgi:cyclic pyranopterin phosphate synthase